MKTAHILFVAVIASGCLLAAGCGGGMRTTKFTHPEFNFTFVERVAVLPLENLSGDQQASERATRLLITELLASGAVDVVGPGEVRSATRAIDGFDRLRPAEDHIVALGRRLQVQAVFVGSVNESQTLRSGSVTVPTVTIDLHMLEAETGSPVWAATQSEKGAGWEAKLLGTGAEPISVTTRRCIRQLLDTLVR